MPLCTITRFVMCYRHVIHFYLLSLSQALTPAVFLSGPVQLLLWETSPPTSQRRKDKLLWVRGQVKMSYTFFYVVLSGFFFYYLIYSLYWYTFACCWNCSLAWLVLLYCMCMFIVIFINHNWTEYCFTVRDWRRPFNIDLIIPFNNNDLMI